MSKRKRGSSTRIYNKFEHWNVEDCECKYCKHYIKKGKKCSLDECCVEDIKQEAIRREAVKNAADGSSDKTS